LYIRLSLGSISGIRNPACLWLSALLHWINKFWLLVSVWTISKKRGALHANVSTVHKKSFNCYLQCDTCDFQLFIATGMLFVSFYRISVHYKIATMFLKTDNCLKIHVVTPTLSVDLISKRSTVQKTSHTIAWSVYDFQIERHFHLRTASSSDKSC